MFHSKLTPAPWTAKSDENSGCLNVLGPTEWPVLCAEECLDEEHTARGMATIEFCALARNAFDVMMRRGWYPATDGVGRGWYVSNRKIMEAVADLPEDKRPQRIWPDPFTALVETEAWFVENVEQR